MPKKPKGKDADVWADPGMQALDATLKQVLSVPKSEIDRREAEYQKERQAKRKHA